MSHFTTIKTEILDPEILKKTLSELKFEFQENGKILEYQGRIENVDIAVKMFGSSCLGFNRRLGKEHYEIRGTIEVLNQLLFLKDKMNTKTAKEIAKERHKFMKKYLDRFSNEWEGRI